MSELAKANLKDEQIIDALQELVDEHGTKAEAIRHALQQAAGSDDRSTTDDEPETVADQLSESSLRKALRKLWEISRGRDGGRDNVGHTSADAAMSVLAQEFAVNKAAVKPMYLTPLKSNDVIDVDAGADQTIIYVVDPDAQLADDDTDAVGADHDPDNDEVTKDSDIDVDDRLAEIDEAEPVRADDDTVDTGDGITVDGGHKTADNNEYKQ
jgi:hypothetical protein